MRLRLCLLSILTLVPGASPAATLRVPSEYATINGALDASAYGDTVLVAPGTYTEYDIRSVYTGGAAPVTATCIAFLRDGVTLLSEAGPEATTLDLTGAPVVETAWVVVAGALPGRDTRLAGFTITGAPTGWNGARIGLCGKVTVTDCHFVDLDARPDASGAGILVGHSDVEIIGCRFENCHARFGGAIHVVDSNVWIDDIDVVSCSSAKGGGVSASSTGPQHNLSFEVRNSRFIDNWVGNGGGGDFPRWERFPCQPYRGELLLRGEQCSPWRRGSLVGLRDRARSPR